MQPRGGTWRAFTTLRGSTHLIWPTDCISSSSPTTYGPTRPPFARLRRCESLCREPDSESPFDISTIATAGCQSGCRSLRVNGCQCGRRRRHASLNFVAPQSPCLFHFHLHDTLNLSRQTRSPLNFMVRASTVKGFGPQRSMAAATEPGIYAVVRPPSGCE